MATWAETLGLRLNQWAALAQRAAESFNARFWYEPGRYLYDVIDGEGGDDTRLRPNQIFAVSLRFPILAQDRWGSCGGDRLAEIIDARWTAQPGARPFRL
jgi:glycogen debranching enzyme